MNLEDLSGDSIVSLNPVKDNFKADEWVNQMQALKEFMANHVCFLAWGAKKKNESNRTPDETKAIALAEKFKAGESVKLEEVILLNN